MRIECRGQDSPVWRIRLAPGDGGQIVLSQAGLEELLELCGAAERSAACRLLVLEGSAGTFCRGMDLEALVADPATHAKAGSELYAKCLCALRASTRMVVSLVDGVVLAGGVGLAAAADLVLATERSTFGLPEVVVGLVPAMVLPILLDRMPVQKARAFALEGIAIGAAQALSWGLVDRVVAGPAELEPALRRVARQALRLEPDAVRQLKRWSDRAASLPWADGVAEGARLTADLASQPARLAQIEAFVAGEPLPWFARYRSEGGS